MILRLPDGATATHKDSASPQSVEPRFFFGLCPVGLRSPAASDVRPPVESLKACSGCLSVCYAGREEQKKDWKRHKAVCKVLQPIGGWTRCASSARIATFSC